MCSAGQSVQLVCTGAPRFWDSGMTCVFTNHKVINVQKFPYRNVTFRHLTNLVYQRSMQFGKGSAVAKALPKSDSSMLKDNKRRLMEMDRKSSSAIHKLMLEHLREALDFYDYYSMPKSVFDKLPKQELYFVCI